MTDSAATREWLEADGLGGYAMGSADGIATRRYHGLLNHAVRPPTDRVMLVNDVDVHIETATERTALSSHRYRGDYVDPGGVKRLIGFSRAPWPTWTYALHDGSHVMTSIHVTPGISRVVMSWQLDPAETLSSATLTVRPLLSGRDHHSLHHENPDFRFDAAVDGDRVRWQPYASLPAIVATSNGTYHHAPDWYRNFLYTAERDRGLDFEEDLATPGTFTFALSREHPVATLTFHAGDIALPDVDTFAEMARRAAFASPLHRAADAYLVKRGDGLTVIAGYPWFTDWGRDSFISLRGLCLATDRVADARAIVLAWCGSTSQGMLPNCYPDGASEPKYNSVDASLWFIIAADALLTRSDGASAEQRATIEATIDAIVEGYAAGTRYHIRLDDDGLLACGEPGVQLTWMDAKIGDWVVTPRTGKPVEIQALWANALAIAGRRNPKWLDVLKQTRVSFASKFWNAERGMLFDVVDCDHVLGRNDGSCRPNQVFAVGGLPLSLLDDNERVRSIIDQVEHRLWTPAGLRTLAPGDHGYAPHFAGDVHHRDSSYHQGTIWPWLTTAFAHAWLRARGNTLVARDEARRRFLQPMRDRVGHNGLDHMTEVADAELPHDPHGCPFQAWSLAELIRLEQLLA